MGARKTKKAEQEQNKQITSQDQPTTEIPTVVSARTGLTPADDAVMRTLPSNYQGKTINDAINYLLRQDELKEDEMPLVKSIKKELGAENFVAVVNGKNAELNDAVLNYLVEKEHKLPNGEVKKYNLLEIEISKVQEGGFSSQFTVWGL
ncbi:hypothetical protein HZA97_08685 [Candidatus Woesearchaeota archaeon]|nr:hypothetical protein [Candidatus Woesearchaeota archaeon]